MLIIDKIKVIKFNFINKFIIRECPKVNIAYKLYPNIVNVIYLNIQF